jgi:predicted metal-dependent phosphoesterase TrpH
VRNPSDVVIDFHSHTNSSWDGQKWFTAERNREWHAAAGFNVAYISDHRSMLGAIDGVSSNPQRAGDGTVLLPGLESRDGNEHIVVIGIDTSFATTADGNWERRPRDTSVAVTASAPLLILTIPADLQTIPDSELHGYARLYAIELSDAAPIGIGEIHREKSTILNRADSLDLTVVAGSDNHGWGSTAVGWTVMQIPNWRAMSPPQLDSAIQHKIRIERRHAARVYVRDSPDPGSSTLALSITAPLVIWRTIVDLDWPLRFSWLGWIVLIASIATMLNSRAARDTIPPAARRKPEKT